MTGVEILTSNEIVIEYAFNWTAFWIVGGIVFGILVIVGIWLFISGECEWGIIPFVSIAGLCLGAILGSLMGENLSNPIEYTTEYKVIISDEVSMTEFNEKYKVVDQDGKIFTIRER